MVTKQLKVLRSNEIIDFTRRISFKDIQKKDYNNLYIRADKSFSENLPILMLKRNTAELVVSHIGYEFEQYHHWLEHLKLYGLKNIKIILDSLDNR